MGQVSFRLVGCGEGTFWPFSSVLDLSVTSLLKELLGHRRATGVPALIVSILGKSRWKKWLFRALVETAGDSRN